MIFDMQLMEYDWKQFYFEVIATAISVEINKV